MRLRAHKEGYQTPPCNLNTFEADMASICPHQHGLMCICLQIDAALVALHAAQTHAQAAGTQPCPAQANGTSTTSLALHAPAQHMVVSGVRCQGHTPGARKSMGNNIAATLWDQTIRVAVWLPLLGPACYFLTSTMHPSCMPWHVMDESWGQVQLQRYLIL